MGESNEHQLWVNLSALGDGNIFAHLPQLMQKMLAGDAVSDIFDDEPFDLILPSDVVWQTKIYYQLVEKQRMADAEGDTVDKERMNYNVEELEPSEQKMHDWNIGPKRKRKTQCCDKPSPYNIQPAKLRDSNTTITWTVGDIAKAGRLLASPPLPTEFEDEEEMRRVYTLIYDVFRYKNVLSQALNDVNFFAEFNQLRDTIQHVWLLLYDLYHRGFKKREIRVATLAMELFKNAGLDHAEHCLWIQRIKLAASVSRLRIEKSALSLNELLPNHLRDQRITNQSSNLPVTCWVNIKKVKNADELNVEIQKRFGLKVAEDYDDVSGITYKWDRHCPQIVAFHSSLRPVLAKSELVRNFKLVVQDKSFCLGPATFGKLVADLELTGSVIQTHVNSPRTTAYLATILSQNERIKKLMAFSAGKRKKEYESYLQQLGMTNVKVFEDKLIDISPDSHYMEEVVAVFATPPNSYSAVNDPIDLVCSRGGDLSMLEILTESEESKEGHDRVCGILDEQRRTLRFAMSRPQIQFVLYETHSELDAENNGMVQRTVREVNRTTKLHHAALQGRIILSQQESQPEIISIVSETKDKEINNNEDLMDEEMEVKDSVDLESRPQSLTSKRSQVSIESEEKILEKIVVPDTDIFATPELPKLCPSETSCLNLQKEGCYLALLQRKQVIRLDNKYMIQMAENRGLFGRTSSSSLRMKSKGSRKKQQKPASAPQKTKRRIKESEVARIATPTHTFLQHTKDSNEVPKCRCCCDEVDNQTDGDKKKPSIRKQWWTETTRHLGNLRSALLRNKLLPPIQKQKIDAKAVVDSMVRGTRKIDEIAAEMRSANAIPVFPKLRLTRENKVEKVKLVLPVTTVTLYRDEDYY